MGTLTITDQILTASKGPLDSKNDPVSTYSELSALIDREKYYDGLTKYVSEEKKYYKYDSERNEWVEMVNIPSKLSDLENDIDAITYTTFSYAEQNRKTLQLKNYDSISGLDTDGVGYNIAMISKWNVADFGATGVHMNLNTKDNVTINDDLIIATTEDLNNAVPKRISQLENDLNYATTSDVTAETNRATEVESKLRTDIDYEGRRALEAEANINNALAYKVQWEGDNETKILLPFVNGAITGTMNNGTPEEPQKGDNAQLVGLSKWNKSEFGSTKLPINLNGSEERPTYNDNKKIAFIDDIDILNNKIDSIIGNLSLLNNKVLLLESKYNSIIEENSEVIPEFNGGDSINDSTKSYILNSSDINSTSIINAKSIVMNDTTLTNNARLKVNANNVEINKMNVSGEFPKSEGNTVVSINNSKNVTFKDMSFGPNNAYNGIEIGLNNDNDLPQNILIDNCNFTTALNNNAISIFGTSNDAIVTISNCYFEKVSNVLRISNKSNTNCTINIINCVIKEWEANPEYSGLFVCQDYTSKTKEDVESNNLFGNGKIIINLINCTTPDTDYSMGKISGDNEHNSKVIGYLYADNGGGLIPFNQDKYPTLNVVNCKINQ